MDLAKSAAPIVLKNLDAALKGIHSFIDLVGEITKKIRAKLKEEVVEPDLRNKLEECRVQLRKSLDCANVYMKRVERLCKFADLSIADVNAIKSAIKDKKFDDYKAYIQQISHYLEQVDKLYNDFKEIHDEARAACEEGRTDAETKITHHQAQGSGTKQTGYVLKVAGTVAGVGGVAGLATVAGLFTFGIGAPVVLGIAAATAGGTAVVGAGAAAGGKALENQGEQSRNTPEYREKKKFLEDIKKSFQKMVEIAQEVDISMHNSKKILFDMEKSVALTATTAPRFILREFELLVKGFKENCKEIEQCHREIKSNIKAFSDMDPEC